MIGKAGAGKDTVGDYLYENYGFERVSFAEPLKRGIKEMFMLTEEQIVDREIREQPLEFFPEWSPRKLFQYFGTELLRGQFDDGIWIKLFHKRLANMKNRRIIITDLRFPNELTEVKSLDNAFAIKVVRPNHIGTNVGISNHASESYDLQGDFELNNDSSLDALYSQVDNLMGQLL